MATKTCHIQGDEWLTTPAGDPRGFIDPLKLSELWFHTGTVCNLSCPFCLEGSKPGDDRLNPILLADAIPFIEEGVRAGVEQFSFTGGEPFLIPEFLAILAYALEKRPCLVLTNGTEPLMNRLADVLALRAKPNPLRFRVSVDFPDEAAHDAGRGPGNFRRAFDAAGRLHRAGFKVSLARQARPAEDPDAIGAAYRELFAKAGLPDDTPIVPFPDFLTPGAIPSVPQITEDCMTKYHTEATRAAFMCSYSKMVVKKAGRMRVYACTLVDDDERYDFGGTLAESMNTRVMLGHHRCYSCFAFGCSCSEKS